MVNTDCELIKEKIIKDGHTYVDYYLVWEFCDKLYKHRIKPVFDGSKTEWRFLNYLAIERETLKEKV